MIDPRLEAARQAAAMMRGAPAGRGGVTLSPLVGLREQVTARPAPKAGSNEAFEQAFQQAFGKKGGDGGGGWKGSLGKVLGQVAQPLQYISAPQRAVLGLGDDIMDILNGRTSKEDLDFLKNVKDPTYGAGRYMDTGSKWGDRFAGFAGDVVTDPLSYLTFGAGKFAGQSGRLAAGTELAALGRIDEGAKVARLGVSSADDAARQALGLGERGIRFGTRNHKVVVPGTQKLDEVVGKGVGQVRARIGDTRLGKGYRALRSPENIKHEIEVLTGRAHGNKMAAAARIYADDTMRLTEGTVAESFRGAMDQWDRLSLDERRAITHAAERGQDAAWRQFDDELFQALKDNGASGVNYRQNHVMHSMLPEGREALKGAGDEKVQRLLTVDDGDSLGLAFERKFQPGETYKITDQAGVEHSVTLKHATIEEINEEIGGILGVKILDDDIHSIAIKSVLATAKDAALARGIKDVVDKFPEVAQKIAFDAAGGLDSSQGVNAAVNQIKDVAATKRYGDAVADNWQTHIDDAVDLRDTKKAAAQQGVKDAKTVMLDAVRDELDTLQRVSPSTKRAIRAAEKEIRGGTADLVKLNDKLKRTLASTQRKLEATRGRLVRAQAEEAAAADTLAEGVRKAGVDRRVERRRLLKELQAEETALAADEAALTRMISLGQEDLVDGLPDVVARGQQAVADVESRLGAASGPLPVQGLKDDFAAVQAKTAGAEGNVAAAQSEQAAKLNDVLNDIGVTNDKITDGHAAVTQGREVLAAVTDDIKSLKARRDALKNVGTKSPARKSIDNAIDELETLARQADPNDPAAMTALQELDNATQLLMDVEQLGWDIGKMRVWKKAAKDGKVNPVMMNVLADGWNRIGKELLSDAEGVVMKRELRESFKRLVNATQDEKWVQLIDEYTKFFKTYATMSPGFHFRNAMSAVFMNYSDGVSTADHARALKLFKQLRDDPNAVKGFTQAEQDAVRAMYGSGVGGAFEAAEIGELSMLGTWTNNIATRTSRKLGEWVEGPARLALALSTTNGGGSAREALARITRLHFDYSQVSKFDRRMKRLIPFWTFMSRNLPLQAQQMVLKPKSYAHYASFVKNFGEGDPNEVIPLHWREQGAFNTGLKSFGGNDLYLAPDLPFTRLTDDLEKLSNPQRLLADFNPAIRVPAEVGLDQKMYTGNSFYEDENKLLYSLLNLVPAASQVDRLSGGGLTSLFGDDPKYRQEKQGQSIASYFGIPARELTKTAIDAELRRIAREGK